MLLLYHVSYQNCCKKAYVNDSQNLAFATTFCNRVASLWLFEQPKAGSQQKNAFQEE
jgi:hypothetical protein